MLPFSHDAEDNRLTRLGYGAASPLWAPFLMAAGMGVGFWMMTAWTRGSFAASLPGAAAGLDAKPELNPAVAANDAALHRPGQELDHNPPPPEAFHAPADPAPPPPVAAEHIMDHTPPETVDAPGNPVVEQRIESAQPAEPEYVGADAGGKAALLAETSAAVLGEIASFGGDFRGDDAAEPSPVTPSADDDGADLADAAYAANFGPVPTAGKGSKKRRVTPGIAPEA